MMLSSLLLPLLPLLPPPFGAVILPFSLLLFYNPLSNLFSWMLCLPTGMPVRSLLRVLFRMKHTLLLVNAILLNAVWNARLLRPHTVLATLELTQLHVFKNKNFVRNFVATWN